MTADEYREVLEEQELHELVGEERLEELRQRHIEQVLEEYEEHLNDQSDEELFGDEVLEQMRQETIDTLADAYENDEENGE